MIIRAIITLLHQNNNSHTEVDRELKKRELIGRNEKPKWNIKTIYNIYHRWKEKYKNSHFFNVRFFWLKRVVHGQFLLL